MEKRRWVLSYTKNQGSYVYGVVDCKCVSRTKLYKELKEVFDMGFIEAFEVKKLKD
tara:strand:- start:396 stop:563 length:168 start_codon:yes stop_codon:yes gene_type:complete